MQSVDIGEHDSNIDCNIEVSFSVFVSRYQDTSVTVVDYFKVGINIRS